MSAKHKHGKMCPVCKELSDILLGTFDKFDARYVADCMAEILITLFGIDAHEVIDDAMKRFDKIEQEQWAESVAKDISGRVKRDE